MVFSITNINKILIISAMLLFVAFSLPIMAIDSPSGNFTAIPETIYFNWTPGLLNLTSNNVSVQIDVINTSERTNIVSNYSQESRFSIDDYGNLTLANYDLCFDTTDSDPQTMEFAVHNTTIYKNSTESLNTNQYEELYLEPYLVCPPGRYVGNITIQRTSNTSDNINITATVDIPIGPENTYTESDHYAFFRGTFTANNFTHYYYLWTNQSANITSVTINLSNFTSNLDLFLFDNTSTELNSSITAGTSDETIYRSLPGLWQMWELRIFGNGTTDYTGNLYFSTLNVTNTFYNQTESRHDFGDIDPLNPSSITYGLRNEDDTILRNVNETFEIFKNDVWISQNATSRSYKILVPNFTTKIEVDIEWDNTGPDVTRWNLSLFNPYEVLIDNSSENYLFSNFTSAKMTETIIHTGPFSSANEGFWNITVANLTNVTTLHPYTLTAKVWLDTTNWSTTTYNQSTTINYTTGVNGTLNVTRNITLPDSNFMPGKYEGFITYENGSGWQSKTPLNFEVKAGNLVINGSIRNATVSLKDNVGFNRLGSGKLFLNISINNTGSYPINFSTTNNLSFLKHVTNSSAYINYTVDNLPSNPIAPGTNTTINITIEINTSRTQNVIGVYSSWILFDTSGADNSSEISYPYDTFNLTIEVNLTDQLFLEMNTVSTSDGTLAYDHVNNQINVLTNQTNVTMNITVRLANGTILSTGAGLISIGNFTASSMKETNTSHSVTLHNITTAQTSGSLCPGPTCFVNATLPHNVVGGTYNLSLTLNWNTSRLDSTVKGYNLTGIAYNKSLRINNTGLYMSVNSGSSITLDENGVIGYVNISVVNYGHQEATESLTMSTWSYATIDGHDRLPTTCSSGSPTNTFTTAIAPYGSEDCWFRFKITSGDASGSDRTTDSTITYASVSKTFNNLSISLRVNDLAASGNGGNGGTTDPECTVNTDCLSTQYCSSSEVCVALSCNSDTEKISNHECVALAYGFEFDSLNTTLEVNSGENITTNITVENTGDFAADINLVVETDDGNITTSHIPDSCTLLDGIADKCDFQITYVVSIDATVGDHVIKYNITIPNETISFTKKITLNVIPTTEKKTKINDTYQTYLDLIDNLTAQIAALEGIIPEENLTKIKILLNQTLDIANDIKGSIDLDDYIKADDQLKDLQNTIDRINTELLSLESDSGAVLQQQAADLWFWIAIIVIVIVVALLIVYMLLPVKPLQKGYTKGGYKPKGKGFLGGLKEKFRGRHGYAGEPKQPTQPFQQGPQIPSKPVTIKPPEKQSTLAYGDFYKRVQSSYKLRESKVPFSDAFRKLKKKKKQF